MSNSERNLQGPYWLALLLEAPRVALQGEIRAGDQFEAGWLVVKVKWYSYHPEGNELYCYALTSCSLMRRPLL